MLLLMLLLLGVVRVHRDCTSIMEHTIRISIVELIVRSVILIRGQLSLLELEQVLSSLRCRDRYTPDLDAR